MRAGAARGSNSARSGGRGEMAAAPSPQLQEMQELLQELLRELRSGCPEELLQRGLERRRRLELELLRTQGRARALQHELAQAEARLQQRLREAQAGARRLQERRRELDTELERAQESLGSAREKNRARRQELQELQEKLQQLEREEEEEEKQPSLPPEVYTVQLYHEISRIAWDCGAEPGRIRGIHFGPEVAVPLDIDTARLAGPHVSDFLWSLVPPEWAPRRAPPAPRGVPQPPRGAPRAHRESPQ